MSVGIASLIETGTKLYLDSIDPDLVAQNLAWGAVGATSNPIIISDLLSAAGYRKKLSELKASGKSDEEVAWLLTDELVANAQRAFLPIWESTKGNAGWVSFELDPLVEDPEQGMTHQQQVDRYIDLGKHWAAGHKNRMIKVPATPAGLDALTPLSAAGVTLNVTLIFTMEQYETARNNVWAGAQQRSSLEEFKSVYSIFVSRVDQYTKQHCPDLSSESQGLVGIVNAKQIWQANQEFWKSNPTPLEQEIIFASTGTKDPSDPPTKYVAALAGSDIQTNPPATNQAVAESGMSFSRQVDVMPPQTVLDDIFSRVNAHDLQTVLMAEGVEKFVKPQKSLLQLVTES